MADISDLDPTDANNTGRWPEDMLGGDINEAGRAMEGYLARWFRDWNASITASGSSNAFAITSNRTIASLVNNTVMVFTANHTIDGASTLNLNGIGAKAIKRFNGNALASGDIVSGQPVTVIYKSSPDVWFMMSAAAALTGNMFADFDENAAPGNPAADVARVYAKDVGGTTRLAYRDSAGAESVLYNGVIIGRAYAELTTVFTTTAVIPDDDTIPQSGEGAQLLTASITPKSTTSIIRGRFRCSCGLSANSRAVAAVFRDSGADAIAAAHGGIGNETDIPPLLSCEFEEVPGTTSAVTYKVRVGPTNAVTLTVNGLGGSRKFGGVMKSTLVLEELQA